MKEVKIYRNINKIITGIGSLSLLRRELVELDSQRIGVVTDENLFKLEIANKIIDVIEDTMLDYVFYKDVLSEPTLESVEKCIKFFEDKNCDCIIGLGGGSCLDTAKLTSLILDNGRKILHCENANLKIENKITTILIPTTAGSGSEISHVAVYKSEGKKKAIVNEILYADVVIIDPKLTVTLPPFFTATSGMDALIHAIESYFAKQSSFLTDILSLEAIKKLSSYLVPAVVDGGKLDNRIEMSEGAFLSAISVVNTNCGGIHALAYPLCGEYDIPHGVANGIMLPVVLRYNLKNKNNKTKALAKALNINFRSLSYGNLVDEIIKKIEDLMSQLPLPLKIREIDLPEANIEAWAREAMRATNLLSNNPIKISFKNAKMLYEEAL